MVDGRVREVTIVEVSPINITFTNINDPAGTVYTVLRNAVAKIIYADGTVLVMQAPAMPGHFTQDTIEKAGQPERATLFQETDFKRNMVSLSLIDLYFQKSTTFAYERISESGTMGVKIPVSLGFGKLTRYGRYYNFYYGPLLWSTGFTVNGYSNIQEYFSTYMGFSLIGGKHRYYENEDYLFYQDPIEGTARFFSGDVFFGAMLQLQHNLSINAQIGAGLGKSQAHKRFHGRLPINFWIDYRL